MWTNRKLALGVMVIAGVTAYMAYLGAANSWQYYLTVDECLANRDALPGDRIRVTGRIVPHTLIVAADRSRAEFSLAGTEGDLPVICSGSLPDELAEGMDVVAEGHLDAGGLLRAHKVLTRCASKYESRRPVTTAKDAGQTGREGDA